ncbi:hypothetical protein ZIOFF_023493 [Zingiber officinale]|uniref:Non-specific lethal 2 homolog n=1 Tax=Zingiber officinale TaxID=94328 RepID=A0A8J5LII9_ZINOF|nr:hypothetical protein ZIOFF_023490 [Zingiber officinale]KAG6513183.1 hypothetical protein ZIOFF_023493 [Zingiber officinale]
MKAVAVRSISLLLILQLVIFFSSGEGRQLSERRRPCDEYYVAEEGDTLQTISVMCDNIFILEDNPQIDDSDDIGPGTDAVLLSLEFLSREEVLRRRSRRAKQLARYYRAHYWALVEEVRVKISDYYRSFGIGPLVVDATATPAVAEGSGENDGRAVNKVFCRFSDCQSTAMPLTRFDLVLNVVLVEAFGGHPCRKPVLRTAVPSFCTFHIHKAKKHVSEAVNKAALRGLSNSIDGDDLMK